MAKIIPFNGIRYNPEKTNIENVVTKPYDKISPKEQEDYYNIDPHNIVRIILGKGNQSDTETDNRYTRANGYLTQWFSEGVFMKEDKPAMYLYDQEFVAEEYPAPLKRRALVALGKVEQYSKKIVFPHEKTLSGPKKDRLDLTIATKTQFGHIFMLYKDAENKINSSLDVVAKSKPLYSFTDKTKVKHTLYIINNPDQIKLIQDTMADKQLLIADGHHRYETALNYRAMMLGDEAQKETETVYDYHMMSFINMYDPGLLILPTHRVVRNLSENVLNNWWQKLNDYFTVEPTSIQNLDIMNLAKANPDKLKFAVYKGNGDKNIYILTLKSKDIAVSKMAGGKPEAWYNLAVTVLHELLLAEILGITSDNLAKESNITYAAKISEAVNMVDDGSHQLAFFVPPTPIESVCDIAFAGQTMPQKSTDFYPKVYTGLVFNRLSS